MLKLDTGWPMLIIYYLLLPLILIIVSFVIYMTRNNDYWKKRGVPFIKPTPLFGNFSQVYTLQTQFGIALRKIYEKCSEPFIGVFVLDQPCLVLNDLELAKHVLLRDFDHFQNKSDGINPRDDPVGAKLLFFAKMPLWKAERKIMAPIFSSEKLKSHSKFLSQYGAKLTCAIEEEISKKGRIINMKHSTNKYTINSTISSFFSLDGDIFENMNSPFLQASKRMMNFKEILHALQAAYMYIAPKFVKILRIRFVDGCTTRFFRKLSWDLMNEREKLNVKKNDLIDIMVELRQKRQISDPTSSEADVLTAHICQTFAAGFETTSTTMCFALFELAKNPECQSKAREEIMEIGKKPHDFDYKDLKSLEYVKNCFLEALRLYSLIPFIDRECTKEYKLPGTDLILEKGRVVYIPVWGIHSDKKYYPNPHVYDPNRFTEENVRKRPEFTYFAFGLGIRNCPGQRFGIFNAVAGIANILYKYELRLPEGVSKTLEYSHLGFVLQPRHDILLEFHEI